LFGHLRAARGSCFGLNRVCWSLLRQRPYINEEKEPSKDRSGTTARTWYLYESLGRDFGQVRGARESDSDVTTEAGTQVTVDVPTDATTRVVTEVVTGGRNTVCPVAMSLLRAAVGETVERWSMKDERMSLKRRPSLRGSSIILRFDCRPWPPKTSESTSGLAETRDTGEKDREGAPNQ